MYSKARTVTLITVLSTLCLSSVPAPASVQYPADAVIDVTQAPYSADPTGVADATAAIQAAMNDYDGAITERHILYFPNGTYRLTGTLQLDTHDSANGGSGRGIVFQGESMEGVVLKLDDAHPDFQSNKVLVDFNEANTIGGWQFVAFQTHMKDLTIDIGSGNPGAIGLDFCASNVGGLRNITIRSTDPEHDGRFGLLLSGIPGPQFLKNLHIDGFSWAIFTEDDPHYVTAIEDLYISNSQLGGLYNNSSSFTVHRFTAENIQGPAVRNGTTDAFLCLLEADLRNGPDGTAAIRNSGFLYVRGLRTNGYSAAIDDAQLGMLSGPNISEWQSDQVESLFGDSPQKSLGLPVEDAPDPERVPPSEWVSALQFGGNAGDFANDAGWVQQAINSMGPGGVNEGKHTLYLPPGLYMFDSGVVIPEYVHRIVGCYARIRPRSTAITTEPVWRISGGTELLVMEELFSEPGGSLRATAYIQNDSDRDLVLRDILVLAGQAYKNSGSGKLYLESTGGTSSRYWSNLPQPLESAIPQFDFGGQDVWARMLDSEQKDLKILNDGGDLWILGIKNEEDGTLIRTVNGGRTELLGGTVMPLDVDDTVSAGFEIVDASMSAVTAGHLGYTRDFYDIFVRETRGVETRELASADTASHRTYTNDAGVRPPVLTLFLATPLTAAEHWRLNHFDTALSTGDAADDADPDLDARINLLERAVGPDPLHPDAAPQSQLVLAGNGGSAAPELSQTVLAGGAPASGEYAAQDLVYTFQWSGDLDGFQAVTPASATVFDNGDGTVQLRWTSPYTVSTEDQQFLRTQVAPVPAP